MSRLYRKDTDHAHEVFKRINESGKPVFILHVETTGLDPSVDGILELTSIRCELIGREFIETHRYHTYIRQQSPLDASITAINHITDDMLVGAPEIDEAAADIEAFMGNAPIVAGFSIDFSVHFLKMLGFQTGHMVYPSDTIDLKYLASCCLDKSKAHSFSLKNVLHCMDLQCPIENSVQKAEACLALLNGLYRIFPFGNETAGIKSMRMFAPSARVRFIYIETDHGKVSVDAVSGCLREETPGFFDIVDLDALIDRMFFLRHTDNMWDFIKSFPA